MMGGFESDLNYEDGMAAAGTSVAMMLSVAFLRKVIAHRERAKVYVRDSRALRLLTRKRTLATSRTLHLSRRR
jgi:hypothetical protein